MAIDKPISRSTAALTKRFMLIPRNITAIGALSCQESICPGACSEKTSRPRDYSRKRSTSETDLESVRRKSSLPNHECRATNWALSLGEPISSNGFCASRRTGFYFAVASEGMVSAGDAVGFLGRDQQE